MRLSRMSRKVSWVLVTCLLSATGMVAVDASAASAATIDVASDATGRLAVKTGVDGSVWATRLTCGSDSCTPSPWTSLGGYVTELQIERSAGNFYIVGRGGDGFIWYRTARCPIGLGCSYGPWIETHGYGHDIQLVRHDDTGCVDLAVIGGDRAVWVTSICAAGAGSWFSYGGGVVDIDYDGDRVYGVDPWNGLWVQRRIAGGFRGPWESLGGFVRSPVGFVSDGIARVIAIGGDAAVWMHSDGGGWQKLVDTSDVGDLRASDGYFSIIHTNFSPEMCVDVDTRVPAMACWDQGGLVTSLASTVNGFSVAIATNGMSYYKMTVTPSSTWTEL